MRLFCREHPTYKAVRPPSVLTKRYGGACPDCSILYNLKNMVKRDWIGKKLSTASERDLLIGRG
jgi:hypothetical protein